MDEERCVDSCAGKLIRANHRLMATYVQLMPRMVQRRMEEMETKAAEIAKAEAAASSSVGPPVSESPQVTPLAPLSVTDTGAGKSPLGNPVGLNTAANQLGQTVDIPLTPVTENINAVNIVDNVASYAPGLPKTPTTSAQIESIVSEAASVQPVFKPKTTSLSEDVSASIISVPAVSKSTENQSGSE